MQGTTSQEHPNRRHNLRAERVLPVQDAGKRAEKVGQAKRKPPDCLELPVRLAIVGNLQRILSVHPLNFSPDATRESAARRVKPSVRRFELSISRFGQPGTFVCATFSYSACTGF